MDGSNVAGNAVPVVLPLKIKCVALGDQSTGKTSIIKRYVEDTHPFSPHVTATVGVDFLCKTEYLENATIRLQMWDTAGQERFHSLIPSYIRDSRVAVIVYDVSVRESFEHVAKWLAEVRGERGNEIYVWIVGNKTDLVASRAVSTAEGEQFAKENNCYFQETSAKDNSNIRKLFRSIAETIASLQSTFKDDSEMGMLPGRKTRVLEAPPSPSAVTLIDPSKDSPKPSEPSSCFSSC